MTENLLWVKDSLKPQKQNYKYMTSISKNVYIDKLGDIINETIHIITQIK